MGGKASLILVIGFSILMTYTLLNMNSAGTRAIDNMSKYTTANTAHNLAVAGANSAMASLYQNLAVMPTITNQTYSGYPFTGTLNVRTTNPTLSTRTVTAIAQSYYAPGQSVSDSVIISLSNLGSMPYSSFGWFSLNENSTYWITGDTVWGQVYSNDNLYVDGSPVFMQKVTTAKNFSPAVGKTSGGHTNKAIFINPPVPTTGAAAITMPGDLSDVTAAAKSTGGATGVGKYYTGDITVTLDGGSPSVSGDGKAYVQYTSGGKTKIDTLGITGNPATFNGVIGASGNISVQGTLDGALTLAGVGTSSDVIVTGNIKYEVEPTTDPMSNDVLGLVAYSDVIMADNTANDANSGSGGTDHIVDASIFAYKGSWTAQNYDSGKPRGNLVVQGSIVQNTRGAVGTFTAGGSPATGYSKRYHYDSRLNNGATAPPHYPTFAQPNWVVTDWWENGTVMQIPTN